MKKTLPLLLLIPFAVSILTYISITPIKNLIEVDISGIKWDYLDSEGFKVDVESELVAEPIYDDNFALAPGNDLVWSSADPDIASITVRGEETYLNPQKEGTTRLTCSNQKGSVSRSFLATVYEDGAITIVDASTPASGDSFEKKRTYGEYDYSTDGRYSKKRATVDLKFGIYSDYDDDKAVLRAHSNNLSYSNGVITINAPGESYVSFGLEKTPSVLSTYSFYVEEEAVNVKDYGDLMAATNLSEEGEKICLQRNLLSLKSTYVQDGDGNFVDELLNQNTRLFGYFDFPSQTSSFDLYQFETTYPHDFLKQYFALNPSEGTAAEHSLVKTGIHVQKDFIGNGFTISSQELAYTYHGGYQPNGRWAPSMDGEKDNFEGPLPYVFLGPYSLQVITAYGQDNSTMYVEGDDITVSDLKLLSVDNVGDLNLLEYVGTTMDVLGSNVEVRDTYLRNGRVTLRVYSSPDFLLDNCYLNNAREFLLKLGNNEVSRPDEFTRIGLDYNGIIGSGTLDELLAPGKAADRILDSIVRSIVSPDEAMKAMASIQSGLDDVELREGYGVEVRDSFFERSGLFAIAFESLFNGAYLYSGVPSFVQELLDVVMGALQLTSVSPHQIGGVSSPVHLKLSGDTRFYDYKSIASIDASCLIYEQISSVLASLGTEGLDFPIDSYFPIKALLSEEAARKGYVYNDGDEAEVLGAIAFYGGGHNTSTLDVSGLMVNPFGEEVSIDYARACLTGEGLSGGNQYSAYLARCVPLAAGSNPFRFYLGIDGRGGETPYLFGETVNLNDLKERGGK